MTKLASLFIVGLALLPTAASAQEAPEVRAGAVVRVWTSPTTPPFIGKVLGQDGTSLTLKAKGSNSPISVTRNSITRMDVSRGRRSRGQTVLYGMLIGLGAGLVGGLIAGDDPPSSAFFDLEFTALEKSLFLSILTVPAGALAGALVGPGPEHWTSMTPSSAKQSQTVAPPAPSLRFSFRF